MHNVGDHRFIQSLRKTSGAEICRGSGDAQGERKAEVDAISIARALHVLGVVMWIGGVGIVTTVLLPAVHHFRDPVERIGFFEIMEARFARQARFSSLLVGGSGFYMTWAWDLWDRFYKVAFWWMGAMVAIWLIFTIMLFVLEPLFLHRWFLARSRARPVSTFRIIVGIHWFLLVISLITISGAVAGSHGMTF
jgi:uncharacterized membrane protein